MKTAELSLHESMLLSIRAQERGRWTINLKFEGLKLMPIVFRMHKTLLAEKIQSLLCWPDAGATALAKHSEPEFKQSIVSFSDVIKNKDNITNNKILIAVSPQPHDYEEFEQISNTYSDTIVILNGKLEDAAVGIGSVARQRRRAFLSQWRDSYWLEPLENGALMHIYPNQWSLFKSGPNGYSFLSNFDNKPTPEIVFENLS
ncbi:DUF1995 family protein [Prochlorococcus sp. MIT 1300]|uniref:DUF1995 family protein n=1 Tax=Prochlorococcus sp. MIT 1300 TaxID=3096218 RepID=UPI002A74B746|nr:DUF1995 family protein [Prochlorococcus sp. MIT 1300]